MRRHLALILALALALAALSGCGKSAPTTPAPAQNVEQAQVSSALASQPEVVDDGLAESDAQTSLGAGGAATALIHPLTYWRTILDVDRRFEFAFSDTDSTGRPTTAVVTAIKLLSGRFNILTGTPGTDGTPMDSALNVVHKPLADRWVRRILLKRLPLSEGDVPRWHIAATSGVQVTSRGATTRILSLRVQSGSLDTTLTDPLAFFRLRRILKLEAQSPVTLTVTTERNDDVVVLQHRDHRFRFHNNGDDTYTGTWNTGMAGPHLLHFGVNALSNGTLFDDQAPYDSQAWILPYVIAPTEMADYLP